jgi:hypothetical protein
MANLRRLHLKLFFHIHKTHELILSNGNNNYRNIFAEIAKPLITILYEACLSSFPKVFGIIKNGGIKNRES